MATATQSFRLGNIAWPVLALIVALIFFFPICWLIFTSFKTDQDAVKPEFLLFFRPTLDNYANMAQNYDYRKFASNSVIVSTFATLIERNRAPEGLFFGRLPAVSTAAVAPIIVLGWFCQKQLVQRLTFGAVK